MMRPPVEFPLGHSLRRRLGCVYFTANSEDEREPRPKFRWGGEYDFHMVLEANLLCVHLPCSFGIVVSRSRLVLKLNKFGLVSSRRPSELYARLSTLKPYIVRRPKTPLTEAGPTNTHKMSSMRTGLSSGASFLSASKAVTVSLTFVHEQLNEGSASADPIGHPHGNHESRCGRSGPHHACEPDQHLPFPASTRCQVPPERTCFRLLQGG